MIQRSISGFQIEMFNDDGTLLSRHFVSGGDVEYEQNGQPILEEDLKVDLSTDLPDIKQVVLDLKRKNDQRIQDYLADGGSDTDYLYGKSRAYRDILEALDTH